MLTYLTKYWGYNTEKNLKLLILFDDMIPDILSNKKLESIVTEVFVCSRELNIPIVFITQSFSLFQKILGQILHITLL